MDITTANRLVQYRKQRGYSQEELAAELGLSRQAVSKWERAEASPDTDNLIALARLYSVSLDELLLNENPPPQRSDTGSMPAPQRSDTGSMPAPQRSDTGSMPAPQRSDSGVTPPPHAPVPDLTEILETSVMNEIADELRNDFPSTPPPTTGSHPPLSTGARRLVGLMGIGAFIVFFFVYGLLSLVFNNLLGAYPLICTALYLALGFWCNLWHPGWLIYLTIPIYYTMFG